MNAPVVHGDVHTMQDRLNLIAQQIDASMKRPQKTPDGHQFMVRDLALEIVRGLPEHGQEAEDAQLGALFNWVAANIEYRQDPYWYDHYSTAGATIRSGAEDCDGHAGIMAALAGALGFPVGAKIVSADGNGWHIYAIAGVHPFYDPKQYLALDTSMYGRGSYPGWEPPSSEREHEYVVAFDQGRAVGLRRLR
jgi:hypothetical protein